MKPDDVATAIADALSQGGAQWLLATLVAFLPALWTTLLIFQLGRPYILRALRRMGLRLGADVWWMSYLLLRDGVLLITFAISFLFFWPNLVVTMSFPITGPLAALCLLIALGVKLTRRADDDISAYRLTTSFMVLGATLYYFAMVFGVEAADQNYLGGLPAALTSSSNQDVALWIMWISLLGVAIVGGWLFIRAMSAASRSLAGPPPTRTLPTEPTQSQQPSAAS